MWNNVKINCLLNSMLKCAIQSGIWKHDLTVLINRLQIDKGVF